MSNHSGSYMLNTVLKKMDESSVFDYLGKEKTQIFVGEILDLAFEYDCNPGEILEDIGKRLGVCYYCGRPADEFVGDICKQCNERLGS